MAATLTRKDIDDAKTTLEQSPLCVRTPLISNCYEMFKESLSDSSNTGPLSSLGLKLEHMQHYGKSTTLTRLTSLQLRYIYTQRCIQLRW